MKKTYINPTLEIIKIQTQQMLAQSAGFGSGVKGGGDAASRDFFADDTDFFDE